MSNYAVIDAGAIVNRIVLDDPTQWPMPSGQSIVQEITTPFEIGGTYINGVYAPPVRPPPPSRPDPIDIWDILALKISFNHENRIRVLEGKAAITLAQFKTALRAL